MEGHYLPFVQVLVVHVKCKSYSSPRWSRCWHVLKIPISASIPFPLLTVLHVYDLDPDTPALSHALASVMYRVQLMSYPFLLQVQILLFPKMVTLLARAEDPYFSKHSFSFAHSSPRVWSRSSHVSTLTCLGWCNVQSAINVISLPLTY